MCIIFTWENLAKNVVYSQLHSMAGNATLVHHGIAIPSCTESSWEGPTSRTYGCERYIIMRLSFSFYLHGENEIRSEWGIAGTFNEWHHLLSIFRGFDERLQLIYDGVLQDDYYSDVDNPSPPGNGQVVIGRYNTDGDHDYASVELDELVFFNRALKEHEIEALFGQYN